MYGWLFILFNKSGMIISTCYLKMPQSALSRLARTGKDWTSCRLGKGEGSFNLTLNQSSDLEKPGLEHL